MLPVASFPLQIQLRLSSVARVSMKGLNDYQIRRPRMNVQMLSVSQSYAAAMRAKLAGSGILINYTGYSTFFQIITGDKQIVVPSNKQRLSKVYAFLLEEDAQTNKDKDAFRSSCNGRGIGGCQIGMPRDTPVQGGTVATYWDDQQGLVSYQFQCGAELSEAITTENQGEKVGPAPNTGQSFLEAYLRTIGAVNGGTKSTEHWGAELCANHTCKAFDGGKLLDTFLCKRFVVCYDAEKLIGEGGIEAGTSTMGNKDIVLSLRFR